MTSAEAVQIHEAAARWALARVRRYRVGQGELAPVTKAQAQKRCDDAETEFVLLLGKHVKEPV